MFAAHVGDHLRHSFAIAASDFLDVTLGRSLNVNLSQMQHSRFRCMYVSFSFRTVHLRYAPKSPKPHNQSIFILMGTFLFQSNTWRIFFIFCVVYVLVYVCVCVYACKHSCVCAGVFVCMRVCVFVCLCVFLCASMRMCVFNP